MSLTPDQARRLTEELLREAEEEKLEGEEQLPESIGGYRILRLIGAGGMGRVYEAEQGHPHRLVALKVLRPGVASAAALRRFQYEADTMARLRHPGVAQVYDAGTHDDGRERVPYFAMEYVPDALPITEYARRNDLGVRQRLQLLAEACDAVNHGHQRGVIHRDLKPANILVEARSGSVKVIDFGVARATDSDVAVTTMATGTGALLGTLQYMSPEQCSMDPRDLDIRTDVYSLGMILYELLCGSPPYDLSNTPIPQAMRVIQEQEPPPPNSLQKAIRGNVATIALKAIEKLRERRYQSASDLAQDIRRHLRGDPIEARPRTALVRLQAWVVRHPVIGTLVLCLTIASLIFFSTWLGLWYIGLRPHRPYLNEDRTKFLLLTIADRKVASWSCGIPLGIMDYEFVDGSTVLLGLGAGCKLDGVESPPGALLAFKKNCWTEPAWTKHVSDTDIADGPSPGLTGRHFAVSRIEVLDIFDDKKGAEILAIHKAGDSHVIRIYALEDGELLYQAWHHGSTNYASYISGARLLVFNGTNQEERWSGRLDEDALTALDRRLSGSNGTDRERALAAWPKVLFAIHAGPGMISQQWLSPDSGAAFTSESLAWYRCLWPPEITEEVVVSVVLHSNDERSRYVRYRLMLQSQRLAGMSWLVDAQGEKKKDSLERSDAYKGIENPIAQDAELIPLPPIIR